MSKSELKYKVLTKLIENEPVDSIAEELDISTSSVLRHKRELDNAKLNDAVYSLMDLSKEQIEGLAIQLNMSTPELLADTSEEAIGDLVNSASAMSALQEDFQGTGRVINTRLRLMAAKSQSVSELSALADTLCALQNAFFNKNTTQVNVQNNYEHKPYGQFLSDAPADQ